MALSTPQIYHHELTVLKKEEMWSSLAHYVHVVDTLLAVCVYVCAYIRVHGNTEKTQGEY